MSQFVECPKCGAPGYRIKLKDSEMFCTACRKSVGFPRFKPDENNVKQECGGYAGSVYGGFVDYRGGSR